MPTDLMRRRCLRAGLASAAALGVAPWAGAVSLVPTLTDLGDGLHLVRGLSAPVVVASAGDELLLVDTGRAEETSALLRLLERSFRGLRIRAAFNTHWHWDRTGGNGVLAARGAELIAHENTRLWLSVPVNCAWEGRRYAAYPASARPNQTFFSGSKSLRFGDQDVEYGFLPQAHTDGDIYVYFPRQNVLVAGDVACRERYPLVDYATNGWVGGMIAGLGALMSRCDERTRVIGSGPSQLSRDALLQQQDMLFEVLSRIGQSYYKGETWAQFLASAPTRQFDAQWGDPALFLRTAYEGAWQHVNEIRRITR